MEVDLHLIREVVRNGNYQYAEHAVKRMTERFISRLDVEQAVSQGEIIEDYPNDKYGPSCLVVGKTD